MQQMLVLTATNGSAGCHVISRNKCFYVYGYNNETAATYAFTLTCSVNLQIYIQSVMSNSSNLCFYFADADTPPSTYEDLRKVMKPLTNTPTLCNENYLRNMICVLRDSNDL